MKNLWYVVVALLLVVIGYFSYTYKDIVVSKFFSSDSSEDEYAKILKDINKNIVKLEDIKFSENLPEQTEEVSTTDPSGLSGSKMGFMDIGASKNNVLSNFIGKYLSVNSDTIAVVAWSHQMEDEGDIPEKVYTYYRVNDTTLPKKYLAGFSYEKGDLFRPLEVACNSNPKKPITIDGYNGWYCIAGLETEGPISLFVTIDGQNREGQAHAGAPLTEASFQIFSKKLINSLYTGGDPYDYVDQKGLRDLLNRVKSWNIDSNVFAIN